MSDTQVPQWLFQRLARANVQEWAQTLHKGGITSEALFDSLTAPELEKYFPGIPPFPRDRILSTKFRQRLPPQTDEKGMILTAYYAYQTAERFLKVLGDDYKIEVRPGLIEPSDISKELRLVATTIVQSGDRTSLKAAHMERLKQAADTIEEVRALCNKLKHEPGPHNTETETLDCCPPQNVGELPEARRLHTAAQCKPNLAGPEPSPDRAES